jgi:hypothetical protein
MRNVRPTQQLPVVRCIEARRQGEPGKFLTTNARRETVTDRN